MTKYGILGIGIMGKAMASNLLHAGFELTVWNRTPSRCDPLVDMGAIRGKSPADVVNRSDVTFAIVSDPTAAEALCFDSAGVLEGISAGKGYIDASTVDPHTSQKICKAVKSGGGLYLEAPVFGSKKPAVDGTLVFLCAGDEPLYTTAQPAFEAMGKKSYYFKEMGQAAQMKLVLNMIMGTMMTAFAEGLALGKILGLQLDDIIDLLAQGGANSPMFQLKGPLMAAGNFSPAFPLKHMQKDLRLALQLADEYGQPLFSASAANNSYIKARNSGSGDEDFSAVFKIIAD